ncbi:cryptochrome/photolyase family protein [Cohaesibacter gelatinilyticus]|uniref:Deoxyribodipyrimidine photolyase-related protein n=1 Tax=Cohaesibacter gelatinilyticus TaxID=372072 RepID=A0A285PHG4_9HYPH|nr:cryptochrome/photolyase family protein [Cohaesibacter gelatinilyticus]SNZ21169.1 deoxyribodipyrimidine photolyase-related protein [Cohaesibacter gelatinilyticus]
MTTLRLILGDQLSPSISALEECDPAKDVILMCEVWDEATYVKHHKKKIAFLFSAMRHFARDLTENGYQLDYVKLDDPENSGSLQAEVSRALKRHAIERIVVTFPGEYRLLEEFLRWESLFNLPVEIRPDTRFLCSPDGFANWARGRKQLRMEYFYREMRKHYSVLIEGDQPVGGQWNYDAENRKPPSSGLSIPDPASFAPDDITKEVLKLVAERFADHFGDLEPFAFAVTREDALRVLGRFIAQRLPHFGDYQDAMIEGEPWMFHSHISFYLNSGLLHPMECIKAAERAWHEGRAPLNAVEGFTRQILGWREYIRGIYWLKMPDYGQTNFLEAKHDLPAFYWTANTQMNCLRQCVLETRANAYAHHIQRLMVLGNFALLAGIEPKQVNEWFLIVYADAYEWVELPNVSGMILYADGGLLASKPYAAGGAYINKMSNYCKSCRFKVSKKNGADACPFNYLYWDFLARNRDKLQDNPRIAMMYRSYDRMSEQKHQAIADDARRFFKTL